MTLLQRLLGTRLVTGTGIFLGRVLPPPAGRLLARLVAGAINLLKPRVYWIVHANLRRVVGPEAGERELHRLVRSVFCHNARNLYDLWHTASRGVDAIRASVTIPPDSLSGVEEARRRGRGVIVVGTHTGNFDLGILAMAARCKEVQILGLAAAPGGGFDLMDDFRQQTGARLTSIDAGTLREAIERLRAGGLVLTGVDRPVDGGEAAVEFFGRPARLPTGHVRLASKTGAAIVVAGPYYSEAERRTFVETSPLLEMEHGDDGEGLATNLRRVTAWLEKFICARPEQWAMFLPVWPIEG